VIPCVSSNLAWEVREGLMARPKDWPGTHCARALLEGVTLQGCWFDLSDPFVSLSSFPPGRFREQGVRSAPGTSAGGSPRGDQHS